MPATPEDASAPSDKRALEVLKQQRHLIAEHLAWLERQIAAQEGQRVSPFAESSDLQSQSDLQPQRPLVSPLRINPQPRLQPARIPPVPGEPIRPYPTEAFDESQAIRAGRDNANGLRLGCIAMAIVAILSVIGFFFVVPYFIF